MEERFYKRYESFKRSLDALAEARQRDMSDSFVLSGTTAKFSITMDLAWKVMKDIIVGYYEITDFVTGSPKEVLKKAEKIARELDHPYVGTEHLLLAFMRVCTGVAGQILSANGVEEANLYKIVDELISPVGEVTFQEKPKRSPRLEYTLEESKEEAIRFQSEAYAPCNPSGTGQCCNQNTSDTQCKYTENRAGYAGSSRRGYQGISRGASRGISKKRWDFRPVWYRSDYAGRRRKA